MLRRWKHDQVAAHNRLLHGPTLELTADEVDAVMRRSFGVEEVTEAVAKYLPFNPRMRARGDALDLAIRQSYARRVTRLRLVPPERLDAVLLWAAQRDDPIVSVAEGQLRVLVGGIGTGKTEQAIRWWDEGLLAAQLDPEVDIPLWLDARDIEGGLDAVVTQRLGHDPSRGCRIVIDNLDGLAPGDAARLLNQARQLVVVWPTTSVLATSRPGAVTRAEELVTVEPWPVQRGAELVGLIAEDMLWRVWANETSDLLTSPLTTLGVAARLRAGRDIRVSRLELLAGLAQTIIEEQRPNSPVSAQTWSELARLAVRVLAGSGPVQAASFGNEPVIWELTETGLVINDDGTLRFALPVLEQHFGAQAITAGLVELAEVVSTNSFPRWRYALANAVSISEGDSAEEILLFVAGVNPGVLSWLIEEIDIQGAGMNRGEAVGPWLTDAGCDDPGELAVLRTLWLRDALQALVGGFGACVANMVRQRDGQLVQWGAWCQRDWLYIGEAQDVVPPPDVVAVPPEQQDVTLASGWARWSQMYLPGHELSRWTWARNYLSEPLHEMVKRRRLPLPPGSPLARERFWVLAQQLMRTTPGQRAFSSIRVAELRQVVDGLMEKVEQSVHAGWRGAGYDFDSHDVRWLHAKLEEQIEDTITPRWPPRDQVDGSMRWRWDGYSPELTLAVHTDALRDALIGYRDLVKHNFPRFNQTLGLYSRLPVAVDGIMIMDESDAENPRKGLSYVLKPDISTNPNWQPQVRLEVSNGSGSTERLQDTLIDDESTGSAGRQSAPFFVPTVYGTRLMTGSPWAATNFAYRWLVADLKAIGWMKGSVNFSD